MAKLEKAKGWEDWFRSDEASEVCSKLAPYRTFGLPSFGQHTKREVSRILSFCQRTSTPDPSLSESELWQRLGSMTIEQLRSYVDSEKKALETKGSDLQKKRKKGWRKATTLVQDFSLTFDRFLRACSGVVELVSCADSQYGNVASATLSVLFAVRTSTVSFSAQFPLDSQF